MSEENQKTNKKRKISKQNQSRPDPSFKSIIGQAAENAGLSLLNVELPQLSISDLIIAAPKELDLSNTMFHFLNEVNLLEFKSENDRFNERDFAIQIGRSYQFFARSKELQYNQIQVVFISSYYPEIVLKHLKEQGIEVKNETEWLLRCQIGLLNIAIVICRLLPVEKKYFELLMFAPTGSTKWQEFVTMVIEQEIWDVLKVVANLKPVEEANMVNELRRKKNLPKSQEEKYAMLFAQLFKMADEFSEENKKLIFSSFYSTITPEDYISQMSPEELEKLIKAANNKKKQLSSE